MGSVSADRRRTVASIALAASTVVAGLCAVGVGLEHAQYILSAAVVAASPTRQLASSEKASNGSRAASTTTPVAAAAVAQPVATTAGLDINISNAHVDKWVNRLATSLKGEFQKSFSRMGQYASMITTKLDKRGMPHDLTYLAMIESEFNPNARSHVGAVGLWQFMSGTARRFGLKVGHGVDERKDPDAETDAALTYLSDLHKRFGSWYLAAAAYNSGEGTVERALKRVTGRTTGTDADFFKILPDLPRETQDYVPKLIASARIGNDPEAYGLIPPATSQETAAPTSPAPSRPAAAKVPSTRASTVKPAVAVKRSVKRAMVSRHVSHRVMRHHTVHSKRTVHSNRRRRAH